MVDTIWLIVSLVSMFCIGAYFGWIQRGIKVAQEELKLYGNWVAINDRLPEDSDFPIIYSGKLRGKFTTGFVENPTYLGTFAGWVTHWISIPKE